MKQVLLIIDAQQELVDSVFQKEKLLENINKVIEKAIQADAQVIFIRDTDVAEGEGDGFEIHPKISVPKTAITFDKTATNAFYKTPLLEYLKDNRIEHIVIMGCKTEHCVDTAVRTATVNGFDVTLVTDGHSTTDSNTVSAETIIKHHNEALDGHYNIDHFSDVRSSDEELFEPNHHIYRS